MPIFQNSNELESKDVRKIITCALLQSVDGQWLILMLTQCSNSPLDLTRFCSGNHSVVYVVQQLTMITEMKSKILKMQCNTKTITF